MATNRFKVVTASIASGTTAHTLLQLTAPANIALRVTEWSVSFQGTSNTAAPVQVDVLRQTTAGTLGTATSTLAKDPDYSETTQTAIADGGSGYSAEPTAGAILFSEFVHPQQGYTYQSPFGWETRVQGGGRLAIRVTAGASVNVIARFVAEE